MLAFAVTLQVTAAGVYATSNPFLALRFAPDNAASLSRLARQLARSDEGSEMARGLAREAIGRDALQPEALLALALSAERGEGGGRASLALMLESQRLSRREVATQLWLARHYGNSGDPRAMLRHFDLLLRTSLSAQESVFPTLIAASADPAARTLLLELLAGRSGWTDTFARYAVTGGANLDFAIDAANQMFDPTNADERELFVTLMGRLVSEGRVADAWEIYRRPEFAGPAAAPLRNGSFEEEPGETPFDWTLTNEPELWAAIEARPNGGGSVLLLTAFNGRAGVVAYQFLRLRPGRHRFEGTFGEVPEDRFERPLVVIRCAASGQTVLQSGPETAGRGPTSIVREFAVPADCPYQRLEIRSAGQGRQRDPLPWVDDMRLT